MKCVLFFAGVLLLQIAGSHCGKEVMDECAKELGISEDMLKEGPEKNHDKPEFRCLHACLLKKMGVLEAGNKINLDKEKEILTQRFGDKAEEVLKAKEECINQAKGVADECDFVNAIEDCMHKNKPDHKE